MKTICKHCRKIVADDGGTDGMFMVGELCPECQVKMGDSLRTFKDIIYKYGNPMGLVDKIFLDSQYVAREHIKSYQKEWIVGSGKEIERLRIGRLAKIDWIKMFFNIEEKGSEEECLRK